MTAGRLHFVTGKGGVGKSTVAAALALGMASRGERVLAVELSPPAGLTRLLGARPPEPSEQVPVCEGLWLTSFDGEVALAEYLRQVLRMESLLALILEHPMYRAFVGSAPGLRELMAVGKLRDELRRTDRGRPRWDAIVVDAGASGHALEHLRMPAVAARTFRVGLVHREARRIHALLRDRRRSLVHVVALPEEMPLQEAAEIVEQLNELQIPIGQIAVNRCGERAPAGVTDALGILAASKPETRSARELRDAIVLSAERALGWLRIQEEGLEALEWRCGIAPVRLPRLESGPGGRSDLMELWGLLEGGAS